MRPNQTPTTAVHGMLDDAFTFFNEKLFDGELPVCLITVQRKKGVHGYFWGDMVKSTADDATIDEIMMAGTTMNRAPDEVLSTLVHEMTHVWQHHYGKPGKGGYHNKEWVGKMEEIGLIPTTSGSLPPPAQTGKKVTHVIDPDGHFSVFCEQFLKEATLDWHLLGAPTKEKKKDLSKVKKTCPNCGAKVWGKAGYVVVCSDCEVPLQEEGED